MKNFNAEKEAKRFKELDRLKKGLLPKVEKESLEEILEEIQEEYEALNDDYSQSLTIMNEQYGFDYNTIAFELSQKAAIEYNKGEELKYNKSLIDYPEVCQGDFELHPDTSNIDTRLYYETLENAEMLEDWASELVSLVNRNVKTINKVNWVANGFSTQKAGIEEALDLLSDYYDY